MPTTASGAATKLVSCFLLLAGTVTHTQFGSSQIHSSVHFTTAIHLLSPFSHVLAFCYRHSLLFAAISSSLTGERLDADSADWLGGLA